MIKTKFTNIKNHSPIVFFLNISKAWNRKKSKANKDHGISRDQKGKQ